MASRYFTQLQTLGINRVRIGGSFTTGPDGEGDIIVSKVGQGWIVSNVSPGIFLVSFDDSYFGVEESIVSVGVSAETPIPVAPQILVYEDPSFAKNDYLAQITLFQKNPLTIGTVPNCTVNFHVVFVNTGVKSSIV